MSALVALTLGVGLTWTCLGYAYCICPQRAILPDTCAFPAGGEIEISAILPDSGVQELSTDEFTDAATAWSRCVDIWGLLCRPRELEQQVFDRYPVGDVYTLRLQYPGSRSKVWFEYVRRPTGIWVGQLWERESTGTI
jgi:hypothetical protein